MHFTFYVTVQNPIELQRWINKIIEHWWPSSKWESNVLAVTQVLEEEEPEVDKPKNKNLKKPTTITFMVEAQIMPSQLNNMVRKYGHPKRT